MALETLPSFFDLGRMPSEGEKVYVFSRLLDTRGMFVADRFLDARKTGVNGEAVAWVPGHGGELWWVRHDDGIESCYLITEMTPRENVPEHWRADTADNQGERP